MNISIILDSYQKLCKFDFLEFDCCYKQCYPDRSNINKSINAKYEIIQRDTSVDFVIQTFFNFGENQVDKILYDQLNFSYKTFLDKYNSSHPDYKTMKYNDLDKYLDEKKIYNVCDKKIIIEKDNYVLLNKNQYITLKSKKNLLKDTEKLVSMGIIIHDNNTYWVQCIENIFKYKKKLLISNNYYNVSSDMITFIKYNNIKKQNNKDYEIIIIDTDKLNNENLLYLLDNISYGKSKLIIRINDNFDKENIGTLYNLLFGKVIRGIIFDNKLNIKYLNQYLKMEKTEKKIDIKNLVKIKRVEYELTSSEENLLSIIKSNKQINDDLDFLDLLGLSFYKKINNFSNESCPICLEKIGNNVCETECKHNFCLGCLSLSLLHTKKCPLCREKIRMNKIKTNGFEYYSKINIFTTSIDAVISQKKEYSNILIYLSNNDIAKFVFDEMKCKYNMHLLCGNSKSKFKKIMEINKKTNNLIIINSKDYNYAKDILNIDTIVILDNKYNFILNKESLGYNCLVNKEPINIIIYEIKSTI